MKSCKDITLLIEKSKEVKLSLKERMQIKIHVGMCKFCKTYKVDSSFLDKVLTSIKPNKLILSPEEKTYMLERIKANIARD